jgi:hypothetical protein
VRGDGISLGALDLPFSGTVDVMSLNWPCGHEINVPPYYMAVPAIRQQLGSERNSIQPAGVLYVVILYHILKTAGIP